MIDDRVEIAPGWYLDREDYEYELEMVGLLFARFLRGVNCAINGHAEAFSWGREHRGQRYKWTECTRCDQILSGQAPRPSEVLEDGIRESFNAEHVASMMQEESPFLKLLGKNA